MNTKMLMPLLLLAGCGPQWDLTDGWTYTGDVPARVDEILEVAHDMLPCKIEPWGGEVEFLSQPFECGGVLAAGCWIGFPTAPRFQVVYNPEPFHMPDGSLRYLDSVEKTALIHEVGHFVLEYCGKADTEEAANEWAATVVVEFQTRH